MRTDTSSSSWTSLPASWAELRSTMGTSPVPPSCPPTWSLRSGRGCCRRAASMQSAAVVDRQPREPEDTRSFETTDVVSMIGAADIPCASFSGSGTTLGNVVAVTRPSAVVTCSLAGSTRILVVVISSSALAAAARSSVPVGRGSNSLDSGSHHTQTHQLLGGSDVLFRLVVV